MQMQRHSMTQHGTAQHKAWHSLTEQGIGADANLKVTKAEGTASLRAFCCSVSIISARHVSLSGQKTRASTWVSLVPYLRSPHMPYWGPRIFNCRIKHPQKLSCAAAASALIGKLRTLTAAVAKATWRAIFCRTCTWFCRIFQKILTHSYNQITTCLCSSHMHTSTVTTSCCRGTGSRNRKRA